jgi:NADH-quinone oxidoreductase subunit D
VAIILAGVDPCYCCTERVAVYDAGNKKKLYGFPELVKMYRKKTERIIKGEMK